ncbi:MAG TPA: BamA/TamA family outer membrane protein [Polyangiaceae bacterium]
MGARWLSYGLSVGLAAWSGNAGAQTNAPPQAELEPPTSPNKTNSDDTGKAAKKPEEPERNVIVPLLMYTPETHVGFGALFVHFFRPPPELKKKVSSFAFFAIGTTRRQAILEAHPDFYLFSDYVHLFGKVEYQYFPDSFWGVGPHTKDEDEERYTRERFRVKATAQYHFVGPLWAGLAADVMDYHGYYSPNGIFANETFIGEEGGLTTGLGPTVFFDTRDNTTAAHSGTLLATTFLWYRKPLSDYNFHKLVLEARQFFDLGKSHAIGARFYGEFQGGGVPYYHLAMLGGDEMLRGYYLGRYRDETLAEIEAEYRYPLFWRFGGVVFAGAGEVSPTIHELWGAPIRWAVGAGGRFSISDSDRLNLRLDAGVGPHTYGVYFTAREAF